MENLDQKDRHHATRPRSARIHTLETSAGHFVLDVETGTLHRVPPGHVNVIDAALGAGDVARAEAIATAFGVVTRPTAGLAPPASVPVRAVSLSLAQKCNLGCTYCYAQQGTFGKAPRSMPGDIATAAVDRLIREADPSEPLTLAFMGGEPLLNRDVLHASTRYAARQASARAIPIGFSMTTNATLVSEDDIALFDEFAFTLTVSIDGVQSANDRLRPFRSGKGSFDTVSKNVRALLAVERRRFRVLARVTVTPKNLDLVETLSALVGMGFDSVMFSPLLSAPSGRDEMLAADFDQLLDQLIRCGDSFRDSLRQGRVVPFENVIKALQRIHLYEREQYPCGAGGGYMGVSADGGLFACHRFVDDDDGHLGDVVGGVNNEKQTRWLADRHLQNQSPCHGCWARYLCSGGCHYESIKRGRPACDYIRGWLHYCLGLYAELAHAAPETLSKILKST